MEETYEELKMKNAALETDMLKQRVAIQEGLPLELANRIVGIDEHSMQQDARSLLNLMKPTTPIPPLKSTEPRLSDDNSYSSFLKEIGGNY